MHQIWDELDPAQPPVAVWLRPPSGRAVHLLLGAFDPPTSAHLALAKLGPAGAFGVTKVLLDRVRPPFLHPADRLKLLDELALEHGLGLLVCNRGTYVDVCYCVRARGYDPTFVIGTDKLAQLSDPAFYPDGILGVRRTFDQVRFLVVPRPGTPASPVDPGHLAPPLPAHLASISATQVRRLARGGNRIDGLVPGPVELALRHYTERTDER